MEEVTDSSDGSLGRDEGSIFTPSAYFVHRTEEANLPIVLTAPHGGWASYGGQDSVFLERQRGPGIVTKGDLHTYRLLQLIDAGITRKTSGMKVHFVAAKFHRKYIDANRSAYIPSQHACNPACERAKDVYDSYHNQVSQCIAHILRGNPKQNVLLLDIHGMQPYKDFVIIGSKSGETCSLQRANMEWTGFMWNLRRVFGESMILPLPGEPDIQAFSGGYTVQRHHGNRVDCIQMEFGIDLRSSGCMGLVAEGVAEAVVRTLFPMRPFLLELAPFNNWSDTTVQQVESKLEQVQIYTPDDLRERLDCVNEHLQRAGLKRFLLTTKINIEKYLRTDTAPPFDAWNQTVQSKVVKNIFLGNQISEEVRAEVLGLMCCEDEAGKVVTVEGLCLNSETNFYERIGYGSSSSVEVVLGEIFACYHEPVDDVVERIQRALNLRYSDTAVIKSIVVKVTFKKMISDNEVIRHKQAIAFYADHTPAPP